MDVEKRITKLDVIVGEVVKAIQSLMIANGAALLATLALLKDYDTTAKYKGIGTFIVLFGSGFLAAVAAFASSFHLRLGLYNIEFQRPLKKSRNWSLWITGFWGLISTTLLAVSVFLIIQQFKSL